jgi:hypothetical protein
VVNTETGERLETSKVKSRDSQAPERWSIKDGAKSRIYFERKDVATYELRKRLEAIPKERLDIRNNVEATLFQLGYHYRSDKSRYRGLVKHRLWAISRCIWVNFRRIQIWIIRKSEKEDNSVTGMSKGICMFNYLRRLLCENRLIFEAYVFTAAY